MDEQEAIIRLKSGDIRGLEILVRKYQLEAVRIAFPVTGDLGQAQEVVQDAFIRVYQCIDQFDETRSFRAWFLRIVVNGALKMIQRQSRLVPLEPAFDDDSKYCERESEFLTFEQSEFSDSHLESEMLQEVLASLTPEHRVVLQLKYYLSMADEEIAEVVQVPVGTVKSRLHAAKQKLRCLLFRYDTLDCPGQK